jgi:alanyl-tRNA synthetase
MTERLYYHDSHLTEFEARVLAVTHAPDGRPALRLDCTAFYPTGGGQPTDTGTLGAARVVECIDLGPEGVLHVFEGEAPSEGDRVRGAVDWPRRLDHIQQHTGQHILSQAFVELFHAPTRSFRMTADACEIDLDLADPSDQKIERAIARANEIIWSDLPVLVHQVTPEEAARLPLRKDTERMGDLRVIEIEGFDFSPCGGTHARRTGEVGVLVARHWERAKGLVRLTFAAGGRAAADYHRANHTARAVAALFSVARDESPEAVSRLREENKQLLRRLRSLQETAARAEARELLEEIERASDEPGSPKLPGHATGAPRVIARILEDHDAESLRALAQALIANPNTIALLGSHEGDGARLVFARSPDAPGDMSALMRQACHTLEGRGGGRPDLAQGGGRKTESLADAIATAARQLAPETPPHTGANGA